MPSKPMKSKLFKQLKPRQWAMLLSALLLVLLIVILCITVNMRANIQRQYTSARNEVGAVFYDQMNTLCQTFDLVDVPGQDVQVNVLPTMRRCYAAAHALNEATENAFGRRYAVLTAEDIAAFDSAFAAYDNAFRTGRSTDSAKEAMRQCVTNARTLLSSRYDGERLKPAK